MFDFEKITAIIELALILLGLVLVAFGWIFPYRQSLKSTRQQQEFDKKLLLARWEKEFIDKQISELYGPIHALILEGDIMFSRILWQLGRKHIIPKDKSFYDLPEEEQKIWIHYVDTYKIKSQIKMVEIMRNNLHLVYKSELPTCYKIFLDYSLGWELLDNQKRSGVPNYYEYHYSTNYPDEFNQYIKATLELLLDEQASLIKELDTQRSI